MRTRKLAYLLKDIQWKPHLYRLLFASLFHST